MALKFYNTLTKEKEEFIPIDPEDVRMYTCGPTVYDYVTIGNWRTYTLGDISYRVLAFNGYNISYVMNITDVGHLTGDNLGDADTGEDRMEKAKKREGKTAWNIADYYSQDFKEGYKKLNLVFPKVFAKATEHIKEQIELVEKLIDKKLAYKIDDGIYFDTLAYEKKGYRYGELSNLNQIKEGARVEINFQKKNPRDFALWKFSPENEKRDMEWLSPWGLGFPGWHIECSAMSMKYLGPKFDLHLGGEDLKSTHHPNEIAQSQGATDEFPFVKYWLHGAFLQVNGGRMGKSLNNAYTLHDIESKKIDLLALRYFYMTSHYRSSLNFTWEALEASENALNKLYMEYDHYAEVTENNNSISQKYIDKFTDAINNDLNMPQALAVVWEMVKDNSVTKEDKKNTLDLFDNILGFKFKQKKPENKNNISEEIKILIEKRDKAREEKDWQLSDKIRDTLVKQGYEVLDTANKTLVKKIK
jgi:cysteinyl-tRNA synthetase